PLSAPKPPRPKQTNKHPARRLSWSAADAPGRRPLGRRTGRVFSRLARPLLPQPPPRRLASVSPLGRGGGRRRGRVRTTRKTSRRTAGKGRRAEPRCKAPSALPPVPAAPSALPSLRVSALSSGGVQKQRRLACNACKPCRMHGLNHAFDQLRNYETLQMAQIYISALAELLHSPPPPPTQAATAASSSSASSDGKNYEPSPQAPPGPCRARFPPPPPPPPPQTDPLHFSGALLGQKEPAQLLQPPPQERRKPSPTTHRSDGEFSPRSHYSDSDEAS
uniref:BHLH domain-containing protein n=1 Tax=Anolis carolinensis TaxID=28377 RepID=A0A803SX44_ANOCA